MILILSFIDKIADFLAMLRMKREHITPNMASGKNKAPEKKHELVF